MPPPTRSIHKILPWRQSIETDSPSLLIAAVQSNPTLGDIGGNVEGLLRARENALRLEPKLDLAVCSELALCGYQPDDLLLEDEFLNACEAGIRTLQRAIDADGRASLLLGAPRRAEKTEKTEKQTTHASTYPSVYSPSRRKLFNSAVLLTPHSTPRWCDKSLLPNYGVFDEQRYFSASEASCSPLLFKGLRLGVMICEDMWQPQVAASLGASKAQLFLVLNASPFERDKQQRRILVAKQHVAKHAVPLLYVNQVGGQDELLFDGGSFALNRDEEPCCMPAFEEAAEVFRFHDGRLTPVDRQKRSQPALPWEALVWQGIRMGIRDYARKNDLRQIVLGLSGGIDSALCAVLASEALGVARVRALFLPSPYTSAASGEDARLLATRLGISLKELAIEDSMRSVARALEGALGDNFGKDFDEACEGVVAENIQARLRAVFLMAYANSTGALLLATSNKSECATGYTTLYGDMGGGYAPLKDLYKTEVFALARWRNREGAVIPERILTKAPSAELRFDQRDEDALAPYEQLDALLRQLIEGEGESKSKGKEGHSVDAALRRRVSILLRRSEHKRFQSPPGPKLGARAFGRDRRYPIVNRFCQETKEEKKVKRR